jgi:hypothetical protein
MIRLAVTAVFALVATAAASADPVRVDFSVLIDGQSGSGFFVFDDAYLAPPDVVKEIPTIDIGFSWSTLSFDSSNAGICIIRPNGGALYWWQIGGNPSSTCSIVPSVNERDFGVQIAPGFVVPNAANAYDQTGVHYGLVTSWSVSVPGPATMLQDLAESVEGVGPGRSLADKVALAQTYFAVPDVQATCAVLTDFLAEVHAQFGKKLANDLAEKLSADAQAIKAAIGCN